MPKKQRKRTETQKSRNRLTQSLRASKKAEQLKKTKERWANNEEYQTKQKKRQKELEAKSGYSKNIDKGIREKAQHKEQKKRRKKFLLEQRKKRRVR